MPLRQPPAEQPFSLIPPNWNPVRNDRVLPHLGDCMLAVAPIAWEKANHIRINTQVKVTSSATLTESVTPFHRFRQNDVICHFDCDGFCR